MNISASSKITQDSIKVSSRLQFPKKSKKILSTALFCALLLGLAWLIAVDIYFKHQPNLPVYAVAVAVIFLRIYWYFALPRKIAKKNSCALGREYSFVFRDEDFQVNVFSAEVTSESTISYSQIGTVVETEKYLFLGLKNNTFYQVDKETIANNTDISLTDFLKTKAERYERSKHR